MEQIQNITYDGEKMVIYLPDSLTPLVLDFFQAYVGDQHGYFGVSDRTNHIRIQKDLGTLSVDTGIDPDDDDFIFTSYLIPDSFKPLLDMMGFSGNQNEHLASDQDPLQQLSLFFWDDDKYDVELCFYQRSFYKIKRTAWYYLVSSSKPDTGRCSTNAYMRKDLRFIQQDRDKNNDRIYNYSITVESGDDIQQAKRDLYARAMADYAELSQQTTRIFDILRHQIPKIDK